MLFKILTKRDLAKLIGVRPRELDHILDRLQYYYRPKTRRKPDGKVRTLYVPHGKLKEIQKSIKAEILDKVSWASTVHGGVRRRSILTNARAHVGQAVVFTMDVKDCFPSIGPERVLRIFKSMGFEDEASDVLTILTTWKFQLPQGAPTSTALANLALAPIDARISGLAADQGFSYTRYVDDITVSGGWRLLKFRRLLVRIVECEGFCVKPSKVETMDMGQRQVVTKLVVNGKVNLPREKRDGIRSDLLAALSGTPVDISPSMLGRVHWLKYVNPALGQRLIERTKLAGKTK
jgi:RNA-directed DNA polymerase